MTHLIIQLLTTTAVVLHAVAGCGAFHTCCCDSHIEAESGDSGSATGDCTRHLCNHRQHDSTPTLGMHPCQSRHEHCPMGGCRRCEQGACKFIGSSRAADSLARLNKWEANRICAVTDSQTARLTQLRNIDPLFGQLNAAQDVDVRLAELQAWRI